MTRYGWQDIADVPVEAGVYAWYYSPEITASDLDQVTSEVTTLKESGRTAAAKEAVRTFLHDSVFKYFLEQPYDAQLRGPLKPSYQGWIEHVPTLSDTLLERLVEEPTRLATVRTVLDSSAPEFASPIYIGMSKSLRTRLRRHKALIEKLGELPSSGSEEEQRDHSFAQEIKARNIPPSRLFVVTKTITAAPGVYVDIENILNRIHYPLLGRN